MDREYPEELPAGYYLDNFRRILDFVGSRYADILTDEEKDFSRAFRSLSLDARRLYVRLISRKGPLFRSDTLHYGEIRDIAAAARELAARGFLEQDEYGELSEELALLRKVEILELIEHCLPDAATRATVSSHKTLRKEQLVELVVSRPDHDQIRTWIRTRFHLYHPRREKEILVYRLLFFGNLHQGLKEFVVTDLGHVRYEPYQIRRKDRLFQSREILELTLRLIELNDAYSSAVEGRSSAEIDTLDLLSLLEYLPEAGVVGEDPDLRRMRDNLLNNIARHLERIGQPGQALHLYRLSERPPSRERQARILEQLGRLEEALALCRQTAADPWEDTERELAEGYIRKLSRKLGVPLSVTAPIEIPVHPLELIQDPQIGIEEAVLRHYRGRHYAGYHTENVLWLGLFGLAFWDIVFKALPGTFFNRYQRGPRDLFRPEFRKRRDRLIRARLKRIRSAPSWPDEILELYDRKQGIANDLVHWKFLPRELLERSLRTIPRDHLAAILDKLSAYPGANKSGFPDLILFTPAGRRQAPHYELIEVKGPGDQLQINQRRWLKYFSSRGIPYRVIRVQWR